MLNKKKVIFKGVVLKNNTNYTNINLNVETVRNRISNLLELEIKCLVIFSTDVCTYLRTDINYATSQLQILGLVS